MLVDGNGTVLASAMIGSHRNKTRDSDAGLAPPGQPRAAILTTLRRPEISRRSFPVKRRRAWRLSTFFIHFDDVTALPVDHSRRQQFAIAYSPVKASEGIYQFSLLLIAMYGWHKRYPQSLAILTLRFIVFEGIDQSVKRLRMAALNRDQGALGL